ncbi:MAG: nitrite/sulfite reductase [Thermoplasmata archaeon]|nr:nitrite/sulfite reductase [Thermoplasmata archaeon]
MKSEQFYKDRIPKFVDAERKFFSGEMNAKEFKGISGGFGSYAQKGGELAMIRLRMCGGHMDQDKLRFIIDTCDRYGLKWVHTTTCETVQLHNLGGDEIAAIMEEALDHGINTQGGGGDNPRNVSATSVSGVEPGEYFDVYPYAKAAESYLLDIMTEVKMPRKLKVTFSSSPRNETHATFRDLGFVARPDGLFDVWSAGGLGNNPRIGLLMAEAVDPSKVLYHVRAMVDNFMEHGNYENRGRARTRYMREDLGDDGYRAEYMKHLDGLLSKGGLDIRPEPVAYPTKAPVAVPEGRPRIYKQKQEGLYYVAYRPVAGDIPVPVLKSIRDAIADIPEAELRISPDSAVYVINLDGNEAVRVSDATEGGADTVFEASVSCIGATICQQGLRDSNGLLKSMVSAVRDAGIPADALPRFRISGCVSSCGCHQVGVVGLQGSSKNVDGKPEKTFNVTVNGCGLQGKERFGDAIGAVPVDRAAEMVVFLGRTVAASGKSFDEWYSGEGSNLKAVLADYLV